MKEIDFYDRKPIPTSEKEFIYKESYTLTIVASLMVAVLFIVGVKVYMIVKNSNYSLLTMILFCILNMIANIVFFAMNTIKYNPKNDNFTDFPKTLW